MRRAALIGLLALAASACTIDVDLGITLTPSGSGSVTVEIVADEEFHSLYRLTGREFEDLVASRGGATGLAFTVIPGSKTIYTASSSQVPADTLTGILEDLAPGIGTIAIHRDETSLEIDGSLRPLTSIADVAPYFSDPASDPGQFADNATVTVTVSMPGELESSTASSSQDGELTYMLPFSASDNRVFARSILMADRQGPPWVLLIVGGIVAFAAVFLYAIRSGLQRTQEPSRPSPLPPSPRVSAPPEDQAVGPDSTPPEDQPVAPPPEPG